MSEQTVIKGYVNMEQVNDWPQSSAGVIHLNKHSRPKFSDISATLILGNGFSEETVRKMLEEMIKDAGGVANGLTACAAHDIRSIALKYGIELNQRE